MFSASTQSSRPDPNIACPLNDQRAYCFPSALTLPVSCKAFKYLNKNRHLCWNASCFSKGPFLQEASKSLSTNGGTPRRWNYMNRRIQLGLVVSALLLAAACSRESKQTQPVTTTS